jgi:hypothetical protein
LLSELKQINKEELIRIQNKLKIIKMGGEQRLIKKAPIFTEENISEKPTNKQLILRNIFLLIWPIEFLILITNKAKKRLGDKYLKTLVLENPNKAKRHIRILALIIIGFVIFGVTTLTTSFILKKSDAYIVAVKEIEKIENIQKETGGIIGYGSFPKGNIQIINDYGQAVIEIDVLGKNKDVRANVILEKNSGENWRIIDVRR